MAEIYSGSDKGYGSRGRMTWQVGTGERQWRNNKIKSNIHGQLRLKLHCYILLDALRIYFDQAKDVRVLHGGDN